MVENELKEQQNKLENWQTNDSSLFLVKITFSMIDHKIS